MSPTNDTCDPRPVVQSWLHAAQAEGRVESEPTKRGAFRYLWNQPLELLAGERIHYVHTRDLCDQGIGLVCRPELTEGDTVYVRRNENDPWIRCRVAHVTPTIGAFRTGVELLFDF